MNENTLKRKCKTAHIAWTLERSLGERVLVKMGAWEGGGGVGAMEVIGTGRLYKVNITLPNTPIRCDDYYIQLAEDLGFVFARERIMGITTRVFQIPQITLRRVSNTVGGKNG